jgi:surfeit locus 1 family protein
MGAADDPVHRRFYALDPAKIGASLGYSTVAPFTLVAIGPAGSVPDPIQAMPRPPNDHLSYAITWFSLSAALVVVFVVYVRQMIRQERSE